jgi:hypothetical protein
MIHSGIKMEKSFKYTKFQIDYLRKRWDTPEGKIKRKHIMQKLFSGSAELGDLADFPETKEVPSVDVGKDLRGIVLSAPFPENLDFSYFHFSGAKIEASDLTNCDFSFSHLEEISFRGTILKKTIFKVAYLTHPDFVCADLDEINLSGAIIDGIQLISHRIFGEKGFKDFKENNGFIDKRFLIYNVIKLKYKSIGRYEEMVPFHMLEMRARRDERFINKKTGRKKLLWYLDLVGFDLLCGYGEKWQYPLVSSFVMMFLFAFLYMPYPLANQVNPNEPCDKFVNFLYFSCVTFSNIGAQDMVPANDYTRTIMFAESIIGLLCITMMVVIYSRKMIRE